jgi:hypothetical protein
VSTWTKANSGLPILVPSRGSRLPASVVWMRRPGLRTAHRMLSLIEVEA